MQTTAARQIITADSIDAAAQIAATLRGAALTEAGQLLGVTLHGKVAAKRQQLVQHSIGRVLDFAAVQGIAGEGTVESWRQRMLTQLG